MFNHEHLQRRRDENESIVLARITWVTPTTRRTDRWRRAQRSMLAKFVKPWWMSLFKLIIECLFTNCVTPAAIGAQHELPVFCSIKIYPNIVQGFLYCVHCYLKDPLTRTSQQQIPNLITFKSNMNKWFVWEIKGFIFNLSDNPDLVNCLSVLISRPHLLVVFRIWFES